MAKIETEYWKIDTKANPETFLRNELKNSRKNYFDYENEINYFYQVCPKKC